ncbi:MAG TPA: deoxyribonuclease IV, partial [Solirubrobacter sp.]|nr:deoxyribonuclease IV [Solirubrobacter sp.]
MLIGAHVSPAGGPANAVKRGEERACQSIQIFNQSPRAWRARVYTQDELDAFHAAMKNAQTVEALVIHAVYLLNCASEDPEIRDKSLAALKVALTAGSQLGAVGVVLHPGSALKSDPDEAITRAAAVIKEALKESDGRCPLLLEDTAGAGGTLGRSFDELARLIDRIGGQKRVGVCLDSCHLFASGYDVRTAESLANVIDEFDKVVGCDRLGALHVNDSMTPLGSNRDRHANLGYGEIGIEGMEAFLSEPRFEGLPMIFEGPGREAKGLEPV